MSKASSLIERALKNSVIKQSSTFDDSILLKAREFVRTKIPALNVAFGGKLDGGFSSGVHLWCGPSKHFKTGFSLLMAKIYMDQYPEAIMILYDCEFGSAGLIKSLGLDESRIVHIPITNMEEFKFDLIKQLETFNRGDKVVIVVDSLGNMGSKKEVEDALAEKSAADMTRAKQMKSIFRIVTPILNMKDIPLIGVNHIYMEQGAMYPKAIVSGGTGLYLSADNIYILGRQQDKDGTEIAGYNFVINVEKSRSVKEKSKIAINVSFDEGVSKFSGLFEMAEDAKRIISPSKGWFSRVLADGVIEERKWRRADTDCSEFWMPILTDKEFRNWVETSYALGSSDILGSDFDSNIDEFDVD